MPLQDVNIMKISSLKILKWSIFVLPSSCLVYLGYIYDDSFYYLVATISIFFGFLFSKSELYRPKVNIFSYLSIKNIKEKLLNTYIQHKGSQLEKISNSMTESKKSVPKYLVFVPSFLTFILYFDYLIIFKLSDANNIKVYFSNFINELINNKTTTLVVLTISLTLAYVTGRRAMKKRGIAKAYVVTLLIAIVLSPLMIYAIGFLHMNSMALQAKMNPQSLGIENDRDKVIEKVKNLKEAPNIINSINKDEKSILKAILDSSKSKYGQYYINNVIAKIPNNLVIKISIDPNSVSLLGKHLFISEINQNDIQQLSPTLGKLLLASSLDSRFIKDPPIIKILGRQEYLKYREDKINEQIEEIDGYIKEAQKNVNILYAGISNSKNNISTSQTYIGDSISKRDSFYSWCINAGYYSYYFNQFYRSYSDEYCNSERAEWDVIISKYEQNIRENQGYLAYAQKELPQYQTVLEQLKEIRDNTDQQKSSTPYELGLFEPENEIRIALDETSSNRLADYLSTLVHEYYHYTSYVSEEKVLPQFFEEGLTEYFARKTISKTLGINTYEGYPGLVIIISEIAKKIPDDKLMDIYFTKNYEALVGELNNAYGEKFYSDSSLYFDVIPLMDANSSLKYVNDILFRIGGKEVSEKDLYSKESDTK